MKIAFKDRLSYLYRLLSSLFVKYLHPVGHAQTLCIRYANTRPLVLLTFILEECGKGDDDGDGDHHQPEPQDVTPLWALNTPATMK